MMGRKSASLGLVRKLVAFVACLALMLVFIPTQANASDDANSNGKFVAGHTYSVPMTVYKDGNSSETSMAAQYFGDTAYVRPSDDLSTLSISFTTSGLDYIESLTYNGSAVSLSGSTFTIEVPYTESDLVVPLDMVIIPMKELGMGTVTADFHFYLSQATDLGTDVADNATPSASNTTLASTGANVATGIAAALILTATGCVLVAKRRLFRF